jgi:hypothetical protein
VFRLVKAMGVVVGSWAPDTPAFRPTPRLLNPAVELE